MTRGCPVSTSKSETRASSRACHARFLLQKCAKDRQTHAELKQFKDYSCRKNPETIDVCRSSVAPAHLPLQSTGLSRKRLPGGSLPAGDRLDLSARMHAFFSLVRCAGGADYARNAVPPPCAAEICRHYTGYLTPDRCISGGKSEEVGGKTTARSCGAASLHRRD